MYLLFVYGSLKYGFPNNSLLNGTLFSYAVTPPKYRLYSCGSFPALVECENGICVEGELWIVDCLNFLDEFEGVDIGLYKREVILLKEPCYLAFTYVYCRPVDDLLDCGPIWKGERNGFQTSEYIGETKSDFSIEG